MTRPDRELLDVVQVQTQPAPHTVVSRSTPSYQDTQVRQVK